MQMRAGTLRHFVLPCNRVNISICVGGTSMLFDHKLRAAVGFTVAASFFACGGGSSSSNGNADGGGSTTSPDCQLPACYYDFVNSVHVCVPMGTCVEQDDST